MSKNKNKEKAEGFNVPVNGLGSNTRHLPQNTTQQPTPIEEEEEVVDTKYKPKIVMGKYNRLISILTQQAESYDSQGQLAIADYFIEMYLEANGTLKDLKVTHDTMGNHYFVKGKAKVYPTIVAHLDQVHDYKYNGYQILRDEDTLYAVSRNQDKHGDPYKQAGTGGDDLCGVWLCLEMLLANKACKVALFVDEEVGCIGSGGCYIDFFKDSAFILQGDRNHKFYDYVNRTNGICVTTPEYEAALTPLMGEFGYSFNTGSSTDVGKLLIKGAGCVAGNIACGYHDAHREIETVSISEVFTSLEFIQKIFDKLSYQRWELGEIENSYKSSANNNYSHKNWIFQNGTKLNDNTFPSSTGPKSSMELFSGEGDENEFYTGQMGMTDEMVKVWSLFNDDIQQEMTSGSSLINGNGEFVSVGKDDMDYDNGDCPNCYMKGGVEVHTTVAFVECEYCGHFESTDEWELRVSQSKKTY